MQLFLFVLLLTGGQRVLTKCFAVVKIQLFFIYKCLGECLKSGSWLFSPGILNLKFKWNWNPCVVDVIQLQAASYIAVWRDVSTTCFCLVVSCSILFSKVANNFLFKKMIQWKRFCCSEYSLKFLQVRVRRYGGGGVHWG